MKIFSLKLCLGSLMPFTMHSSHRMGPMALIVWLVVLSPLALAQGIDGVYRGTLGTQEIIVQISSQEITFIDRTGAEESYPLQGRYFYRRYGKEILLVGSRLEDGSIRIQEFSEGFASGAEWRLTINGDKASGVFCKCDVRQQSSAAARRVPIVMTRISTVPDQAYHGLLLAFPLKSSAEVRVNDQIAYVVQTDPRFKASLPQLTRFPDAAVMARVNQDLSKELNKARLWAAECLEDAQAVRRGGDWSQEASVTLLTRDILRACDFFSSMLTKNE